MCEAPGLSIPRPTVLDAGGTEVGAAVEADALQVLLDVLKLRRRTRDRLERDRTEAFRAGCSPYGVRLDDLETDPDVALLPEATRHRLEATSDDRWHDVHRSMLLAGYPPGAADGRCDQEAAITAVPAGETAGGRTIVCSTGCVDVAADGGGLAIDLDGGRARIDLRLETDAAEADLVAAADRVRVTHHSASALEAARSLGGALADTPAIAVLFERGEPVRRYGDRDTGVGTIVDADLVERLEQAEPLPDPTTVTAVATALEAGPFTTSERLAICRLLAGEAECIRLRYGTGVPRLVAGIAAVADCDLVPVPQTGTILVAAGPVPSGVESLAVAFPDRQSLTAADCDDLATALGRPDHVARAADCSARFRAVELAAEMAAEGTLDAADAFCLEVSPWIPRPERPAIRADVDAGARIVAELDDLDRSYGADLAAPALCTCWERAAGPDAGPYPVPD